MPPPPPSGFKFQTVDESEVAARLIECVAQGPRGRVADFGGPDVPPLEEIPTAWTEAGGIMKTAVRLPVPGAAAAAFRTGANTAPGGGGRLPPLARVARAKRRESSKDYRDAAPEHLAQLAGAN